MRNRRDLAYLEKLIERVVSDPTGDYDDVLFNTITDSADLEKEILVTGRYKEDNGKKYVETAFSGDGKWIRFSSLLKGFLDEYALFDGFTLGPVIIERDFIEELLSGIGVSDIAVVVDDITHFEGDAIVNAANCTLLGGGGVDGAIHEAAGPELLEECRGLGGCETGHAKLTKAYNLPCDYVIHTVGPVYSAREEDKRDLASCYISSLKLAKKNKLHTIAFPCISTGVYGYPKKEAAEIALAAIEAFIEHNPDYFISVTIVCFTADDMSYYLEQDA